jgi:hypothetical protein
MAIYTFIAETRDKDLFPVELNGTKNAWCRSYLGGKFYLLLNIVNTKKFAKEIQKGIDKNMKTYTIIIEFLGGTYVSQYLASMPRDAFLKTINEMIKASELDDFNKDMLEEIPLRLEEIMPVALSGLNNIWYFSFSYKNKLCNSHIIETVV